MQEACIKATTPGYDFSSAAATVLRGNFSGAAVAVTIPCATGYNGTAAVSVCGAAGTPYTVSGCQA